MMTFQEQRAYLARIYKATSTREIERVFVDLLRYGHEHPDDIHVPYTIGMAEMACHFRTGLPLDAITKRVRKISERIEQSAC